MTTEDEPILCMSRSIGSWMVRLHAVSVAQFLAESALSQNFAAAAVERLISGATVHDTDSETCYSFLTYRPSAVKRQWLEFRSK